MELDTKCEQCGETIPAGATECPACGAPAAPRPRPNPFGVALPEKEEPLEEAVVVEKTCPNCGETVPIGGASCPKCGAPMPPAGGSRPSSKPPVIERCANCGSELPPGVSYCSVCGWGLTRAARRESSVVAKVIFTLLFVLIGIPAGLFGACSLVFAGGVGGPELLLMAAVGMGIFGLLTWLWIRSIKGA